MYKCKASNGHKCAENNREGRGGSRTYLPFGSHKMQFLKFLCLYTTHLTVQKIFLIFIYPS